MRKTQKIMLSLLVLFTLAFLLASCRPNNSFLKTGVYVSDDEMSYVEIDKKAKTYIFLRGATSYRPSGKFIIDKDRLLFLNNEDRDQVDFEFIIDDNKLIFQKGDLAKSIIEKGQVFTYQGQ